jgi:hypothetical protein
MEQILSALGIGTVVFVSTNVDDIFLLSAFFSDPSFTSREIIVGQFLGIAALVLVSVACALLTFAIPEGWIGLLGLAPLVIGLKRLWALWRGARDANAVSEQTGGSASRSKVLSVAGITIANGADNLGVYIPLFSNAPHLIPFYSASTTRCSAPGSGATAGPPCRSSSSALDFGSCRRRSCSSGSRDPTPRQLHGFTLAETRTSVR